MKKYHITYYYSATGMEGREDRKDHGFIMAESAQQAIDKMGKRLYPKQSKLSQTWGLIATEITDLQ